MGGERVVDLAGISSGLTRGDDGIWYASEVPPVSYPDAGNDSCYAIEERSFWFAHRNRCITALLAQFPPPGDGALFDIGAGNGFVARAIADAGIPVVVVEPGAAGTRNARVRGLRNVVCASLESARFSPKSLASAGLFDVVEHLPDDAAFLGRVRDLLIPGGRVYLTVPAYPALWSDEDEIAGHHRRYTRDSLGRLLKQAGLVPEFSTHIFRVLPVGLFLFRVLPAKLRLKARAEPRQMAREHASGSAVLRRVAERVFAPEIRNIERRKPMRIGGSILAVARTP